MFVNTLPFRFEMPEKGMSVRDFLIRVSDSFITAHSHARYPFEHVKANADNNNTPLSALMWTLFNYEERTSLPLERVHVPPVDCKLDFSMDLVVNKSGWSCVAEYKPSLFSAATVRRVTRNYQSLLANFAECLKSDIYDVPYVGYHETSVLLASSKWSTSAPRVLSTAIHRNFEQLARAHPSYTAARCGDTALSYKAANELAEHFASQIAAWDKFDPLVPVILLCSRDEDVLSLMLGVWKCGGFFVPLSSHTRNRLTDILLASGAVLIITNMEGVEAENAAVWSILLFYFISCHLFSAPLPPSRFSPSLTIQEISELKARSSAPSLKSTVKPSINAYRIYTSGSTGVPKPCTITHANLQTMIHAWRVDYQIEKIGPEGVRVLQWAPFSFDVFLADVMRANFCAAGTLVICPEDKRLDTGKFIKIK
jgi:iturin family lipopeptide synthetase A